MSLLGNESRDRRALIGHCVLSSLFAQRHTQREALKRLNSRPIAVFNVTLSFMALLKSMCHKWISYGVRFDSKFIAALGVTPLSCSPQTYTFGFTHNQLIGGMCVCVCVSVGRIFTIAEMIDHNTHTLTLGLEHWH